MKIDELYKKISTLDDYRPSEEVNNLFSSLVANVIDPLEEGMLSDKKCACLQKICSHAEYEMEVYWAKKIIEGGEITDFPYYKNYKDLTRLEWGVFDFCLEHENHNVLFVGSGPLPMTAIMLAMEHNIGSTLVDNDPVAVDLSRSVIKKLGLDNMISVIHADAKDFNAYVDFNVIFVAALAGTNFDDKEKLFSHIKEYASTECHIVARSSWGRRKLLYAPLPDVVYKKFRPIIEISPFNEIVNSIVILKNDNRRA